MKFENRTAVITGAAGRIGRALAREFGRVGVRLYLTDIDRAALDELADELRRERLDARTLVMDVTDPEQIGDAAERILEESGGADILVNNAGQWPRGTLLATSDEAWCKIIELNLTSVFRVTKAFLPPMKERRYGRIVNLGSIAGEVGLPGFCAYSAGKAGVIGLTKTLAMELAQYSITVNSVSPGMIGDSPAPNPGTWLGRGGTGDEVARAIVFLAADDSGYITGADLPVDGGRILGPRNATVKPE